MKTRSIPHLLAAILCTTATIHAQGTFPPPSGPAVPTQKSLQELWDKVGSLQTQLNATQTQLALLSAFAPNLSWILSTVDSAGSVGQYNSLAFGPDGQPAISYYNGSTGDLKYARFNATTWDLTTPDSTGNVGQYTSLVFGPDGQPAISYYDVTNGDLKFARQGVFKAAP